jgi:hypothetical protein
LWSILLVLSMLYHVLVLYNTNMSIFSRIWTLKILPGNSQCLDRRKLPTLHHLPSHSSVVVATFPSIKCRKPFFQPTLPEMTHQFLNSSAYFPRVLYSDSSTLSGANCQLDHVKNDLGGQCPIRHVTTWRHLLMWPILLASTCTNCLSFCSILFVFLIGQEQHICLHTRQSSVRLWRPYIIKP